MEKYKFCFMDNDVIIEADNHQKALNKVIHGDPSILGWIKAQYKWENKRWRRIY